MPAYRILGVRIPSFLIALLLPFVSGCADTRNSANSLNASIGSPCGATGVIVTTGAGTVAGGMYGLVRATIECVPTGPAYPFCVGVLAVAGAASGLIAGLVDGIVHAPACRDDDEAGVASDDDDDETDVARDIGAPAPVRPAIRPLPDVARVHSPATPAERTVRPIRQKSPFDAPIRAAFLAPIRCPNGFPAPACGI